jgi:retron-type reverse transcriptase
MPKRKSDLFNRIVTIENLRLAYKKTSLGKKSTVGYLRFKEYAEYNLLQIQKELVDETYVLQPSRKFTVYEPKEREIEALEFRDRLVQHALCNIITPIFEETFLPNSYACRTGMGTHGGVKFIQSKLRSEDYRYFLKTDYSKYFASIDISILLKEIEKKIKCRKTLRLIKTILGSGVGVKIGWLTSQLSANIYGNILDKHLFYTLGLRDWVRYMDDVIVLGNCPKDLKVIKKSIKEFSIESMGMGLSKWQVSPVSRGINFLGYRIWKNYKLIRKDSVSRAKKKILRYKKEDDAEALRKFKAAWLGHIKWSNAYNLKVKLGLGDNL